MAATLQPIVSYLDNKGWKYGVSPREQAILAGLQTSNNLFNIAIRLVRDGKAVEITMLHLLEGVKTHPCKGILFQTLLAISYQVEMLRFSYDPRDGEVRASISILLEDASLTEQQFNVALQALIHLVDEFAMPRLKAVMQTGEDPGQTLYARQRVTALQEELNRWNQVVQKSEEA